jgi:hypothetical protein
MNEKIRELALQSGAKLQFNRTESATNQWSLLGNDNLAQFAELIIQECCSICLDPNNWYEDAAGETFSALIKQKFGIE